MRNAPDTRKVSDGDTARKFIRRVGVVIERRAQELGSELQAVGKTRFKRAPVDHRLIARGTGRGLDASRRRRHQARQAFDIAPAKPAQQGFVKRFRVDRLRDVIVHSRRQIAVAVRRKRIRRHRQDRHRRVARQLPDPARGFESVQARHLDVHQDQVVIAPRSHFQRFDPVRGGIDRQSGHAQQVLRHFLIDRIVLDQQQRRLPVLGEGRFVVAHLRTVVYGRFRPQHFEQGVVERRRRHRLGEKAGEAGAGKRLARQLGRNRRDQDQCRMRPERQFAQTPRSGKAVHLRHPPVEQDKTIGAPRLRRPNDRFQRRRAGGCGVGLETETQKHLAHRLARLLQIIDDEHPDIVFDVLRKLRPQDFVATEQGQLEPEATAFARCTLATNAPAHHLGQAFADGESEAGAAVLARRRNVGLLEDLEQPALLLFAHADPGVADFEADAHAIVDRPAPAVMGTGFDDPAAHENPSALGELDGVADEVEQDLAETIAVAMQRRRQMVGIDDQFDILACRLVAHHVDHTEQHAVDREVAAVHAQLAGFDLRQIEHVVDDAEQVMGCVFDLAQANERPRIADLPAQQVRQADDGVHRRADLVTHIGEEGALGQIGFLSGQLRRRELGRALLNAALQAGIQGQDGLLGEPRFGHIVVNSQQLAFAAGDDEATEDQDLPDAAVGAPHLNLEPVFGRRLDDTAPVACAIFGIDPQPELNAAAPLNRLQRIAKIAEPGLVPARHP